MNIDLSTHSAAINDAISKVRDGKGIDWYFQLFSLLFIDITRFSFL